MQIFRYLPKTIFILVLVFNVACGSNPAPKPRGYFRIALPEKNYTRLDSIFPYSFEYPDYAKIQEDNDSKEHPYWTNLAFPRFGAKVHLSYRNIDDNLYQILEDSRELAYKHTVKADAIQERLFQRPEKDVYGILFVLKGNTASPIQFYATDSVAHFLRGSLYFNTVPNKDSIAPVLDFVEKDIIHLMESLNWNE